MAAENHKQQTLWKALRCKRHKALELVESGKAGETLSRCKVVGPAAFLKKAFREAQTWHEESMKRNTIISFLFFLCKDACTDYQGNSFNE